MFLALCVNNISKTLGVRPTINDYALSIGTKIDDLEWPWPAISSNFRWISYDFADLGGNNGYRN